MKLRFTSIALLLSAITLGIASLSLFTTSCRQASQWRVAEGAVWNTTYRIVYDAPTDLSDSIAQVMHMVEMSLSPFNDQSRISRINRCETDTVDSLIATVFRISQDINRRSNGRFDPTVSPLINLWGFGYDRNSRRRADAETTDSTNAPEFTVERAAIDSALELVGIADCAITNGRITKKHPGTTFNFSAVTKGYGCDLVADMLKRNGSENHMVEIGGEVTVAGHNTRNADWRIQIDAPIESTAPIHEAMSYVALTDCGIATSGNYRNFHDTRRYGRIGHTIDTSTGMPVHSDVVAATVIAPTTALADAWATACMASTATNAINAINAASATECLLVVAQADTLAIITSIGFPSPNN
jgi:thiamine biosynthesis lipoprotein